MLSYRHAFHAGNHADVLKHFILVQLLDYLNQKDKPYWYIDTHAGAGMYALQQGYAAKLKEYEQGIARLWGRPDMPDVLASYVDLVRSVNPDGALKFYPGSPYYAAHLLRPADRLRLFELHSSDSKILQENFQGLGRRVQIQQADGFAGLKALLPPPPRRALVMIDPSYEVKEDYRNVVDSLKDALKRFATGIYAVWYPQLQRVEARQLPEKLKLLPARSWLNATLTVQAPGQEGIGMQGSGMFILNPPWTLEKTLKQVMPYLVEVLGQDLEAGYTLEYREQ